MAGKLYGFYYLLDDPYYLQKNHHLPSPSEGDYIRFTIALVLGLQFAIYLLIERKVFALGRWEKICLICWAVLTVVYIHLQAAKSGFLCLYVLLLAYLPLLISGKRKLFLLVAAVTVSAIGITGVFFMPSLRKQLNNISYEQKVWETSDTSKYNKTSSFVPRIISYKIAIELIGKYPLAGVGAGDLKDEMDKKYARYYPNIAPVFKLLPHNQFLCTVASVGLVLALTLPVMLLAPLFCTKRRIYSIATLMVMGVGMMIEPMLEIQYGVFVYLFFTLFWIALLRKSR